MLNGVARVGDDERAEAKGVRQGNRSADEDAIAHIEGGAALVLHGIVRVG